MARPWAYSRKLKAALLAEFVGMAIFQIYGGNSPDSGERVMRLEMKQQRNRGMPKEQMSGAKPEQAYQY
jgi:hypothetical protein